MKRQFLMLVAIAAFALILPTNAFGQAPKTVDANVKFDFQIGDRVYPAGKYRIAAISRQSDNILQIRSLGDGSINEIIVATHSNAGRTQKPRAVFHKYGEKYFLSELFLDTEQWGYRIRPSRRQRESEETLASRLPRND